MGNPIIRCSIDGDDGRWCRSDLITNGDFSSGCDGSGCYDCNCGWIGCCDIVIINFLKCIFDKL